ncbi:MAG TPA: 2-oxo acid dehydrogenase subunit E2 [Ktedonobacterales bacterium]|nr:2-oxo acid dehydrogenase subunit E2 [Ktedonobacterales bacterium]
MRQQHADYQVVQYPRYQRFAAAAYQTVRHKQMIHGLIEVDVTRARTVLREHKARTGEALSFTAFLAACLAKAVDEHKAVQAFRKGGRQLILFDDVDISTRMEHEVAGAKYVILYTIRAANRKSVRQIHNEIRAAQAADVRHALTRFPLLPAALFRPFAWAAVAIGRMRPRLWKTLMGTVGLTSVGMFGTGAGWGIPASSPTALLLTVGGIGEKQAMVDGRSAVREYLSLTISVDHDLVDGAPAARFSQRLKELIESGYGLDLDHSSPTLESSLAGVHGSS